LYTNYGKLFKRVGEKVLRSKAKIEFLLELEMERVLIARQWVRKNW